MNGKFTVCMAVAMLCTCMCAATARATYITGFETSDDSDYDVGETVIGVDNWVHLAGTDAAKTIQDDTVFSGTQSLEIAAGNSCTRDFTVAGNTVVCEVDLAMDAANSGHVMAYFLDDAPLYVLQVGFDGGKLAYRGSDGTVQIDHDFVVGDFYHYKATSYTSTKTWDLVITSTDDTTFAGFSTTGIGWRDTPSEEINQVRLYNGGTGGTLCIDNLSVVPEPATIVLLGCGGLMAIAIAMLRRRRK